MFFTGVKLYLSVLKPFTLWVAGTVISLSLPELVTWTIDIFNQGSLQRLLLSIDFIIASCLRYFTCFYFYTLRTMSSCVQLLLKNFLMNMSVVKSWSWGRVLDLCPSVLVLALVLSLVVSLTLPWPHAISWTDTCPPPDNSPADNDKSNTPSYVGVYLATNVCVTENAGCKFSAEIAVGAVLQ